MKQRFLRRSAIFFAFLILNQTILPTVAMALTSGPTQPEVLGFQPIGASDMVNLFTGDFSYNIPLGDVDGYPLNLAYQADPRMEDEASWVGLGWSLNPGVITREVRGYPDDFRDEEVVREISMRDDYTVGGKVSIGNIELFGFNALDLNISAEAYYNNYRGLGSTFAISPTLSIAQISSGGKTVGLGVGADLSFNSGSGLDFAISPSIQLGLSRNLEVKNYNLSFTGAMNSRQGIKDLGFSLKSSPNYYSRKAVGPGYVTHLDEKREGAASGSIGLVGHTYFPTGSLPITNDSYTFDLKLGPTFLGGTFYLGFNGYTSTQSLETNTLVQNAYGYLYHQDIAKSDLDALMDYNKGPGLVNKDSPRIPAAFGTYDLFNVSGQGIGGQFRIQRLDLGILRSARVVNSSLSQVGGLEVGGGNLFQTAGNYTPTISHSEKRLWSVFNRMNTILGFSDNQDQKEAYFFTNPGGQPTIAGEKNLLKNIGAGQPIRTEITQTGSHAVVRATSTFEAQAQPSDVVTKTVLNPSTEFIPASRIKRNNIFSYLNSHEAAEVGLDRHIISQSTSVPIERTSHPEHHLSELTINQPDGMRYVYGIPAYNLTQQEVTFSIESPGGNIPPENDAPRITTYEPGDNSFANDNGREQYFDKTTIPQYAHSYLLTAILSPDYVDVTGDGITDDDLGNAVRLNYDRAYEDFAWRIPMGGATEPRKANYQQGLKSDIEDDKVNYLYGEKEIWYLHSIESRTMVAQFHTVDRRDGHGVVDEDGDIDGSKPLQQLKRIDIFSKSELLDTEEANPIKSIHFEYDYTLCEGVPNHLGVPTAEEPGTGKLTLKKVYFTYGNSDRGKLNAYQFDYKTQDDDGNDFNYDPAKTDRWGLYQDNPSTLPANSVYPYVNQDYDLKTTQAGAWNLNEITLPSGGNININYEPDDYAYVQDKRAGQMFKIAGFTSEVGDDPSVNTRLYDDEDHTNRFLVVDGIAEQPIDDLLLRYFEDVDDLYFQCLVDINGEGAWEYVKGYLEYDRTNIAVANGRLYIPLTLIDAETIDNVHPISYAGIQKIRLERPALAYPGYEIDPGDEVGIETTLGFFREIGNVFSGFVRKGIKDGWSQHFHPERAWVRLSNPNYAKIGGGTRVAEISISDEWNLPNADGPNLYGQKYYYEKPASLPTAEQPTMSSGVAAYEPLIGGEENLLRNAETFNVKIRLAPNNSYYVETPAGESLYPAPVVGYSHVRVENLNYEGAPVLGHTEHEFYTAREFPVIETLTDLKKLRQKPDPIMRILRLFVQDEMAMSQGLVVEINDMHGKQKAIRTRDANNQVLQSTEYSYRTDSDDDRCEDGATCHLNNTVSLLEYDGNIATGTIGYNVDTWTEMDEDYNNTTSAGVAVNTIGLLALLVPVVAPFPHPTFSESTTSMRTSSTTKFIQRFGILDKVTVMENGSTLSTENLLYDSETGEVLLTKTQNEFADEMYSFNYPAHWAYAGMAQAYQNIGALVDLTNFSSTQTAGMPLVIPPATVGFFQPGDELIRTNFEEDGRLWVVEEPLGDYVLLDQEGTPFLVPPDGTALQFKIIRSGHRNQASTPIAAISSKVDPSNGLQQLTIDNNTKVINASAITFSENWKMRCNDTLVGPGTPMFSAGELVNPYVQGLRGQWRPAGSYTFYDDRDNTDLGTTLASTIDNTIREKGTLSDFTAFWVLDQDYYEPKPDNDLAWTKTSTITLFDQRGNELENQDALGIYSSAQFGYNQNRAVAIASNAAAKEMAFDGFEDYGYENYEYENPEDVILPFRKLVFSQEMLSGSASIVDHAAHTGRYAAQIAAGNTLALHLEEVCLVGGNTDQAYPVPIISSSPNPPYQCGTPILFSATGSYDPDGGDIIDYEWVFTPSDQVVVEEDHDLNPATETVTFLSATSPHSSIEYFTVQLGVTDDDNMSDVRTINVTVNPNTGDDCANSFGGNETAALKSGGQLPDSDCNPVAYNTETSAFTNTCCSCLPGLVPEPNKDYLLSIWVATDNSLACGAAIEGFQGKIKTSDGLITSTIDLEASGPVIEGWQRFETKIPLPPRLRYTDLEFTNTSNSDNLYLDDFRFHPFNSNMQSYVYDATSLRLWATLDENNYATFYEYDDEGLLVRVKRETERGIMTVQESRTVLKPNNEM